MEYFSEKRALVVVVVVVVMVFAPEWTQNVCNIDIAKCICTLTASNNKFDAVDGIVIVNMCMWSMSLLCMSWLRCVRQTKTYEQLCARNASNYERNREWT